MPKATLEPPTIIILSSSMLVKRSIFSSRTPTKVFEYCAGITNAEVMTAAKGATIARRARMVTKILVAFFILPSLRTGNK